MSGSGSPPVVTASRGWELMLLRSTLSMSDTMPVTTVWSNRAGRAIWRQKVAHSSYSALPYLCCVTCGSLSCSTWARCKKEVCLRSDDTKCLAMGSFLAARHSGRFSSDEASQRSQCLAKLRISDKRLLENFSTLLDNYWVKSHFWLHTLFLKRSLNRITRVSSGNVGFCVLVIFQWIKWLHVMQ